MCLKIILETERGCILKWNANLHISRITASEFVGTGKCTFVQPFRMENKCYSLRKLEIIRFASHQQYESMATVLLANDSTLIFSDAFSKNGSNPVIPMVQIAYIRSLFTRLYFKNF